MKYSKLSKKNIKNFAGEVIFDRGYNYYVNEMVEDFEYDPARSVFSANIYGNFGCYDIKAWSDNDYLKARCNCPYDGYPCKHIVAVLLYFCNNKESYTKKLKLKKQAEKTVKKRLLSLTKAELVDIIISYSQKYPSIKRELMLKLSIDKQKSTKEFFQAINKIFRKLESDNFSTYEISRELKEILKQIEPADNNIKTEVLWKITDNLLYELNAYGMNDRPLEDLAIETMDLLVQLLNENPDSVDRRKEIRIALEKYCEIGNCGITDYICDASYELLEDET